MGRPRAFDEDQVVQAAASLFASRAYDGISVDDLVSQLGVHRNSLYQTFGSKRGLYLAALRWHIEHQVRPWAAAAAEVADAARSRFLVDGQGDGGLDLLLLAAIERAPDDAEVAAEVRAALAVIDQALAPADPGLSSVLTATLLGLRLRSRADALPAKAAQLRAVLAQQLSLE